MYVASVCSLTGLALDPRDPWELLGPPNDTRYSYLGVHSVPDRREVITRDKSLVSAELLSHTGSVLLSLSLALSQTAHKHVYVNLHTV